MSVAPVDQFPHPLVVAVDAIEGALHQMSTDAWAGLEPGVVRELTGRMMRLDARLKAHQLAATRVLETAGVARQAGATSTGAMLAGSFGGDRRAADAMVRQAKALGSAPATETALAGGRIGSAQAAVIADAVAGLPGDTTAEQKQACEDTLIGDADRYSIRDLRRRALRITDQFKTVPEVDAIESATLEQRERAAWKRAEFWIVDNRDGTHRGGFTLPEAQADMLLAAVQAISAPRRDHLHDHPGVGDESVYERDLSYRTRLGMGFAELCGHLPADRLPSAGGVGATLVAHFDYDTLLNGVKAATLSTGTRISAGQVRQMACNLGIIPQVFAGTSLPLDHGAEKRVFTKAQRRAMEARDHGCTFPECDRPPQWTEGHHAKQPFSVGKTTRLDEGVLICPHHHRVVHDQGWSIRFHPDDGIPEYRASGETVWKRKPPMATLVSKFHQIGQLGVAQFGESCFA